MRRLNINCIHDDIGTPIVLVGDVQAFVELSAEKYGVRMGGHKGNISLVSYDGKHKVQVRNPAKAGSPDVAVRI